MPKEMLIAIGAGLLSATAAAAFLGAYPFAYIIVYLAPLPLFTVGLAFGPKALAVGGAAGFMFAGLWGSGFSSGGLVAGVFALTQALPAWMVVRQMLLQRPGTPTGTPSGTPSGAAGPGAPPVIWYPAGDMLCWLALLAAGLLAGLAISGGIGGGGLSASIGTELEKVLSAMAPDLGATRRAEAIAAMAPLFPGAVGVSWVIMIVANAVLAQGLLVRFGGNLRPTPDYADISLPQWMSWPLIGAAVLALVGAGEFQYTGRNLVLILAVPYFFLGLAVIHAWAGRKANTLLLLVGVYLMILVFGWAAMAVTGIGLVEQWSGLRKRLPAASGGAANDV